MTTPTAPATPATILTELRSGTAAHHKAMEEHVRVMDPSLTLDEYKKTLKIFQKYHVALEEQAAKTFSPEELDSFEFQSRRKAPFFEKDFKALNITQDLPHSPELPKLDSYPKLPGCFYVLEGSTLGGQFMTAHLQKQFNLTPESGSAFFNSYGQDVKARWQAFCKVLENKASNSDVHADIRKEIVESASQTFEKLGQWFTKNK